MFDTFSQKKFLLTELVKKNLTAKYKDSVLGILWSFFNPLLTMLVFTAVFSMLFGKNVVNYPVYYLAGRLMFDFYNHGTKGAMNSIRRNARLLKKIYVPRPMFPISSICYEFVNFLISFGILFGVMIITHAQFNFTLIYSIIPISLLIVLIFGVGLILAVCNTYFTDIGYLYNVFMLMLLYASALFYPIEIVPTKFQILFSLNPVYCAMTSFRQCVYGVVPSMSTLLYLAAFAFTALGIGILLFNIYGDKLTLEL
ncbi:MAG: ABC transporter permease [Methanobrevibacter thaueri]|nr:ABC transporter permease [Methanobrevibacter thaueri]